MDWFLIGAVDTDGPTILQQAISYLTMIASVGLGLGFVIFVHELGHFLVAKACGVKCEKFYVGFDFIEFKLGPITIPRALWKRQIGETEYGIGILPLGGYVKMLGQDDDPRNAEAEAERCRVEGGDPAATPKLDPRSYPAKSVPQRMAIISAGVIMNLITGVFIAAAAYGLGVDETPAFVGGTIPGDPAWKAGLMPGDKVVQIGHSERSDELRFSKDMTMQVIFNGADRQMPMQILHADGKEEDLKIQPTSRLKAKGRAPTSLGIKPYPSLQLAKYPKSFPASLLAVTDTPIVDGDLIKEINGKPIEDSYELISWLTNNPSEPLKLSISRVVQTDENKKLPKEERKREDTKIVVQPLKRRDAGLIMQFGGIVAIRDGSPASKAGLLVNDKILKIAGEDPGDPLTLGQRLLPQVGKAIEITVLRATEAKGDTKATETEQTITITPEAPRQYNAYDSGVGSPIGVEPLGIALDSSANIVELTPTSPLKDQVLPGDVVTHLRVIASEKEQAELKKLVGISANWFEGVRLDDNASNWSYAYGHLNSLPPETTFEITVLRSGVSKKFEFKTTDREDVYDEGRNLPLTASQFTIKAKSFGEAMSLGAREIKERITEVVTVISRLVTGRISVGNLSGPLGILSAAGASASRGTSTLLMFFTLLSANLAVLNILPVPALDGGHLVFLVAEWIRGKPVDERLQIRLTVGGVLCLLSLMVFATFNDITTFLSWK